MKRPDWRDELAYPADNSPDERWRWEFLRRSAEYEDQWVRYRDDPGPFADLPDGVAGRRNAGRAWSPHCRRIFGIAELLDPDREWSDADLLDVFRSHRSGRLVWLDPSEFSRSIMTNDQIVWAFDMSKPIRPQIEAARAYLEALQEKPDIREHSRLRRQYLRVLDARADGQKWRVIGAEILLREDSAKAAHQVSEQARKFLFRRWPFKG